MPLSNVLGHTTKTVRECRVTSIILQTSHGESMCVDLPRIVAYFPGQTVKKRFAQLIGFTDQAKTLV